jgi:tetratricopeptide (TPR) repeat protein
LARYNRKRARELKHDAFRDRTMEAAEWMGNSLEGKGRTILYGLLALVVVGLGAWALVAWRGKKSDEASRALGRAIQIAEAPVTSNPPAGSSGPTFTDERDRAQRAISEFQKVSNKYSGQTKELADYFIAANLLTVDRAKGEVQLEALTKSSDPDIAARAKYALASAYQADGKMDQAAALYKELAQSNREMVPADLANLRLALVLEKQGKTAEATDLLFNIVSNSRKAQDKNGKPLPVTASARDAEKELEKLDPARYAQLPPAPPPDIPGI